jgi:hypothetical protein
MIRNRGWIGILLVLAALLAACAGASPAGDHAPTADATLMETVDTNIVDKPILVHPRLAGLLNELYVAWLTDPAEGKAFAGQNDLLIDGDRTIVVVILSDEAYADHFSTVVSELGGEVSSQYKEQVAAWIPIPNLVNIADLPGVVYVKEPAAAYEEGFAGPRE